MPNSAPAAALLGVYNLRQNILISFIGYLLEDSAIAVNRQV